MLSFSPASPDDYKYIVAWNDGRDAEYLHQWAGYNVFVHPLTAEQLAVHAQKFDRRIYMIYDGADAIGSYELDRIDPQSGTAFLCRFILRHDVQGKGVGEAALRMMADFVFNNMGFTQLKLGVYCFNVPAIRCYEKVGFRVLEYRPHDNPQWNMYIMDIKT